MAVTEIGPLSFPVYGRFMMIQLTVLTHFCQSGLFSPTWERIFFLNFDCSLWSDNNPASKDIVMGFFSQQTFCLVVAGKAEVLLKKNINDGSKR